MRSRSCRPSGCTLTSRYPGLSQSFWMRCGGPLHKSAPKRYVCECWVYAHTFVLLNDLLYATDTGSTQKDWPHGTSGSRMPSGAGIRLDLPCAVAAEQPSHEEKALGAVSERFGTGMGILVAGQHLSSELVRQSASHRRRQRQAGRLNGARCSLSLTSKDIFCRLRDGHWSRDESTSSKCQPLSYAR